MGIISQLNNLRSIVCFIFCPILKSPIEKLLVFFSSECEHLLSEGIRRKLSNCWLLSTAPSHKSWQPFLKEKAFDASIFFAPAPSGYVVDPDLSSALSTCIFNFFFFFPLVILKLLRSYCTLNVTKTLKVISVLNSVYLCIHTWMYK